MDKFKEKVEEIVNKVKNDKDFASKFKSNPKQVVEDTLGVKVPDDKIDKIIEMVKAKLSNDKIIDTVSGLEDKIKGLFK